MAEHISRDKNSLTEVFKKIIAIDCEKDGVVFDAETIKTEAIAIDKKCPGLRFYVTAHMDTIVHSLSVDIGFGDVVSPYPIEIDFPLLLPDIPSINLRAYSLETVVAEKFHTMIDRDEANSRMKDFFDCYQLLTQCNIDDELLFDAIKATFDNRALACKSNLKLFSEDFAGDKERLVRWKAFLKKYSGKKIYLSQQLCRL